MARRVITGQPRKRVIVEHGDEVWILGATGRSGRAVAARLASTPGVVPVLVGRDRTRLDEVAEGLGGSIRTMPAASLDELTDLVGRARPSVVVNTIGPFSKTAVPLATACLAGSHYVDLANDLESLFGLLGMHDEAVAAGRTFITGAGFGVLATESVVMTLCEGLPTPSHVRVDALPSVASEVGVIGAALAATIIDGFAFGGRRYERGRLVPARVGAERQRLTLPDGTAVTTSAVSTGDLHAAWLASGSPSVTAGSSLLPDSPALRMVLPVAGAALSLEPLARLATRLLARTPTAARARNREHSFGHALVSWPDGTTREGWLRAGEAMEFTAAVMAECVVRLARSDSAPGAYTPAAALGPELATSVGGEFVLD
jgi:short subunit dehydrogenase-like uncharacterized protein